MTSSAPFDKDYVLGITKKHMLKSIELSIQKTFSRIPEFEGNSEKSREILETLSCLHQMQKALSDN